MMNPPVFYFKLYLLFVKHIGGPGMRLVKLIKITIKDLKSIAYKQGKGSDRRCKILSKLSIS